MYINLQRRSILRAVVAGTGVAAAHPMLAYAQAGKAGSAVYPLASPGYMENFIAMTQGYFKEEGLNFQLIHAGSGTRTRGMLAAGQADLAIADLTHSLQLSNRGKPSKVLAAVDARAPAKLLVRRDLFDSGIDTIQKAAEWKRPDSAKPILAVSSLGGTLHIWGHFFAEKMGLDQKFSWMAAGNVETMLGSLKSKQVDLLMASHSMAHDAESNGWGKTIYDFADDNNWNAVVGGKTPVTAHFALQSTIDSDPAKVQAYVNGIYRAKQFIKASSADKIYGAIEQYIGSTSASGNLIEINATKRVHDYNGIIDSASYDRGVKVWFGKMLQIKPVAMADAVNNSFVNKARAKIRA